MDTRSVYPVEEKAGGKLTVLCHIAVSLINIGNSDFYIIPRYGVLGTNQCIRHMGSILCGAFSIYQHPVFHDMILRVMG